MFGKMFCRNEEGKVAAPPGVKALVSFGSLSSSSPSGFMSWPSSDSMESSCSSVRPILSRMSFTGLMPSSFAQLRHRPCGASEPFVGEMKTTAGRLWHLEHSIMDFLFPREPCGYSASFGSRLALISDFRSMLSFGSVDRSTAENSFAYR